MVCWLFVNVFSILLLFCLMFVLLLLNIIELLFSVLLVLIFSELLSCFFVIGNVFILLVVGFIRLL